MQKLLYIPQGFDYYSLSKSEVKEFRNLINGKDNKFKYCISHAVLVFAIYFIFGLNPIAFATGFIVTDIFTILSDFFTLRIYPTKILPNLSQKQSEKRMRNIEGLKEKLFEKNEYLIRNYCDKCYEYSADKSQRTCTRCTQKRNIVEQISLLDKAIKSEKKKIKETEKTEKKVLLQKDEKKSSDYENKVLYFETTVEKIDFLKNEYNLTFLTELKTSIENLIDIIKKKDNAILMVNRTTYLYLDELQKILNKVVELDGEKKESYISDIEKISKALAKNINNTISQIEKSDIEDIDVGISVLMQELLNENEREVEDNNV